MNMDILAVDITNMSTYDFLQDGETEVELLERANSNKQKDIESWTKNCKEYPCEQFEAYLKQAKEKEYKIMSWDEFEHAQRDFYINRPLVEITEECFDEMLNILPPLKWCTIEGVNMFCISEMYSGCYTEQYAKKDGKYYTKMVDVTDKNTWIHKYL